MVLAGIAEPRQCEVRFPPHEGRALTPRLARKRRQDGDRDSSRALGFLGGEAAPGVGAPPFQVWCSRFQATIQEGPVQRQKTQIVQSCMTLEGFLPVFVLQTTCRAGMYVSIRIFLRRRPFLPRQQANSTYAVVLMLSPGEPPTTSGTPLS